jgi:hypothetical protein
VGDSCTLKVFSALDNSGTVDLNGALIIDYAGTSPLSVMAAQIGTHIISTSAAGDSSRRIGYAEASDLSVNSFAGVGVDNTSALLMLTIGGDANLDRRVDANDLGNLAANWQSSADWFGGDFNYDGFTDLSDLFILAGNWPGAGSPLGPLLESLSLPSVPAPEPTIVGTALAILLGWRPRRNTVPSQDTA